MFRGFVYILIGLFLITVIRMFAGVIFKGINEMMQPSQPETAAQPGAPAGGELKRDPVCGTFVATSTSLKKTVGDQTVYFCSTECRDKYPS